MLIKLGENLESINIEDAASVTPLIDENVLNNFRKFATELKKVAPKADDFLYFSAVIIHAAECVALNEDGSVKLKLDGTPIKVGWDTSHDTWKWVSNDLNVKPYKNANGDIFPESELIKAYRKWVNKPLCIDHKSSSVDHVRGFIVDTYYDRRLKRVIALCALDKKNYPDLARKVSTRMSTAVSMGTAVGRAICTECGRVARIETDFCDHMKKKTCYGEINIDLNPIELSIVVNGADPKAHIKHVIAVANTLNSYVENKERELKKIAEVTYNASISMNDSNEKDKVYQNKTFSFTDSDLDSFKKSIGDALEQLESIKSSTEDIEEEEKVELEDVGSTNDFVSNQSSGTEAMDETLVPSTNFGLSSPAQKLATDSMSELRVVTASIEAKLNNMKQSLDRLVTFTTQEEKMSGSKDFNKKGYYQGTEEPEPGQPKYDKDPLNEKMRLEGDKQMVGQMDTGPVDGMHPGPDSVGMSELERKKMLARAEAEERAMRRSAAVQMAKKALEQKKAYFQGGGGVNEPTPGKPKYPVDKLQDDLRENEDKQMVGQKPFPDVGSLTGLHPSPESAEPSDELKRKQMLQRASLKAKFIKAANDDGSANLGNSTWQVFLGDKLLLTASVNELSGNNADMLYDSIATREFGTKLIDKVKKFGAEKVRNIIKKAQAPAPEPPPAEAPAPAPESAPAEPPPEEPAAPAVDTGEDGDPEDKVRNLAEQVRDLSSDLVEAIDKLLKEKKEMGEEGVGAPVPAPEALEAPKTAMFSFASLNVLRRELNGSLTEAMREVVAELNSHEQELNMIADMYEDNTFDNANKDYVNSIVNDAVVEAKASVADGLKLVTAFIKYAQGAENMVKNAESEKQLLVALAEEEVDSAEVSDEDEADDSNESDDFDSDDLASLIDSTNADIESVEDMMSDDIADSADSAEAEDVNDVVSNVKLTLPAGVTQVGPGDTLTVSRAERAELRAKLAAEALKYSPILDEAHPRGGTTVPLDVKPSDDLAKIEDLKEVQNEMLDLAKAPPKVRKEAESIYKLVTEGKLDPADLDALVAEGLDKDAVAYYKKYYGQVDGGSEFASELVKEHVKAEIEAELNKYRIKLARAYELTYEMVDRGLCPRDREAINGQVNEVMECNEKSFESLKRVVAKHALINKEAGYNGRLPQVGVYEPDSTPVVKEDMTTQISNILSNMPKRMF